MRVAGAADESRIQGGIGLQIFGAVNQMSIVESTELVEPEPAWDVARLFPAQGYWTVEDYLELTESAEQIVEFTDGFIEVLPMPTTLHQRILVFLLDALRGFVNPRKLGEALPSGLYMQVRSGKFRGPDIIFMRTENKDRIRNDYWDGADLAIEIVSPDPKSHKRDYNQKRYDYAEGGVLEYWIVDPQEEAITVLKLEGDSYAVHGEFRSGARATSRLLEGFEVAVAEVFAAGEER
jgi:Uma2 family endonuclease